MRKQRYIVLQKTARPGQPGSGFRKLSGANVQGFGTRAQGPAAEKAIEVKTDEMTTAEAARRNAEKDVAGVALSMPISLIKSTKSAGTVGANWGIDEIGASASKFDGSGVKVAVLDTGIFEDHPAFAGVKIDPKDFTNSPSGASDIDGHGTHCAGTIFGRDVDGKRIGVALGITEALIGKVLGDDGSGDSAALFEAMQWATRNGANIISMSLGFDFPKMVRFAQEDGLPEDLAVSNALVTFRLNLRAFDSLLANMKATENWGGNALVIAAAGNESRREDDKEFRISASLPAAADGVISVAALGMARRKLFVADFSNSDPMIAAPGVNILSASLDGGLEAMNGTSQACPHVAGLAALWWQKLAKGPVKATPQTVSDRLLGNARELPGFEWEDCGRGLAIAP